MPLNKEQKNIVISDSDECLAGLLQLVQKITKRTRQFKKRYGKKIRQSKKKQHGKKTDDDIQTDLTKLSIPELKTHMAVLAKLRAEIINVDSSILYKMQKIDREIVRRQ